MLKEDYKPGPPAQVSCEDQGDRITLIFVREMRHPPEKVWAALTEAKQVELWAPFGTNRDLIDTGPVTLQMNDGSDPREYPSTVNRVIAPKLLEYTWGDDQLLSWELAPTKGGTRLTLRHTVADRALIAGASAGWHMCLDIAELLIDGFVIGPILGKSAMKYGWTQLHDHYKRALNIDESDQDSSDSTENSANLF